MNSIADKVYINKGNQGLLQLIPSGSRTVLDVGCGAGDNAQILQGLGCEVDGITVSSEEAKIARNFCRDLLIHDLEKGLPLLRREYDIVICSHVLEHICSPSRLLRDIRSVLRPGGYLLVALPNMLFYKNRIDLLFGNIKYAETGLMDATHYRWYTFCSAQELLKSYGYTIDRAKGDGSVPIPLRSALPGCITRALDEAGTRLVPGLFAYQMLFCARPSNFP
jgi:2-polyprenyl-3-methyl-5-hydroxy-6-metoxy-1,4-benzoquinol methylase